MLDANTSNAYVDFSFVMDVEIIGSKITCVLTLGTLCKNSRESIVNTCKEEIRTETDRIILVLKISVLSL